MSVCSILISCSLGDSLLSKPKLVEYPFWSYLAVGILCFPVSLPLKFSLSESSSKLRLKLTSSRFNVALDEGREVIATMLWESSLMSSQRNCSISKSWLMSIRSASCDELSIWLLFKDLFTVKPEIPESILCISWPVECLSLCLFSFFVSVDVVTFFAFFPSRVLLFFDLDLGVHATFGKVGCFSSCLNIA